MKICITLDDVIRAKTFQFGKIYKQYIDNDIDLDTIEFTSNNLCDVFKFENKKAYEKFLYNDFPFEIFGKAAMCEPALDKKLNLWHLDLEDIDDLSEPVDIMLSNTMEFNASIGFTYFFFSRMATRIREIFLPMNSVEIFDKCDVVITADNRLLDNKPEGKITIKIKTDYNKDCESDYTYNNLSEFLDDKEIISKLDKQIGNERNA